MSAQLDQVLNYLDREGVTDVIIAVGQPMQFRRKGALVPITAAQLTRVQVASLTNGTPLAAMLGTKQSLDVEVGKRMLHVEAGGAPETPSFTIRKATPARVTAPAPAPAPAPSFAISERARRPSRAGRSTESHDTRS
nr:hypothetical protein [Deltaproteobacteria bacterium]